MPTAVMLEEMDCYNSEVSKAFGEVVGNIRASRYTSIGEIVLICITVILGLGMWLNFHHEATASVVPAGPVPQQAAPVPSPSKGTRWLKMIPLVSEIALLLVEDVLGLAAYNFHQQHCLQHTAIMAAVSNLLELTDRQSSQVSSSTISSARGAILTFQGLLSFLPLRNSMPLACSPPLPRQ
jgi:hypothetical protein